MYSKQEPLSLSELLLFRRIAEGDEEAFRIIFELYLPKLFPFLLKLTKSEQAARDIIQETYIRVWINRDQLADVENPGGWLYRIASNECYNYLRKMALQDKFSRTGGPVNELQDTTHEMLALNELKRVVEEAINKLPAQRKLIYQRSRTLGKTIPEIAAELGISPNTVKNALVISLKFIREHLIRSGIIFLVIIPFIYLV